jgi:hypothetical protein
MAVKVGNARDFHERGYRVRLGCSSALQQQFAQVHELALLILNRFIQILDGNVIPFAQDLSKPLFLHDAGDSQSPTDRRSSADGCNRKE